MQTTQWSPTDLNCQNLFFCLQDTGQLDVMADISTAGTITVSQLLFSNQLADISINQGGAYAQAALLDNKFFAQYIVSYADGVTQNTAIAALTTALQNGNNTLTDVAIVVGQQYSFKPLPPFL